MKSLMRRIRNKRTPEVVSQMEVLTAKFPDATTEQISILESVQQLTMTSPERILALCNAVDYISVNGIVGDVVECGVWRGGSMAAVAKTLLELNSTQRKLWLYDTFEGMSEPTHQDVDYMGQTAHELMDTQDPEDAKSVWCCSPIEQVKKTMADTGYPTDQTCFIEGKVEETLPLGSPEQISLLRLDTDWYESTMCELEHLFPKLVPGGVLIVDDYGHWEGCRRAVDEYFARHQIKMMLNRIDYTGRIGIYYPI